MRLIENNRETIKKERRILEGQINLNQKLKQLCKCKYYK